MRCENTPNVSDGRSPPPQTLLASSAVIPEPGDPRQRRFRRRAASAHVFSHFRSDEPRSQPSRRQSALPRPLRTPPHLASPPPPRGSVQVARRPAISVCATFTVRILSAPSSRGKEPQRSEPPARIRVGRYKSELRPEFGPLSVKPLVAALRAAFCKISPPSGARAREASGELPSWDGVRPWVSVGWRAGGVLIRGAALAIAAK